MKMRNNYVLGLCLCVFSLAGSLAAVTEAGKSALSTQSSALLQTQSQTDAKVATGAAVAAAAKAGTETETNCDPDCLFDYPYVDGQCGAGNEEETPIIPPPVVTEETYIPPPYVPVEEHVLVIHEEEATIIIPEEGPIIVITGEEEIILIPSEESVIHVEETYVPPVVVEENNELPIPPVVTEETYIPPPYIVTEEETIPPVVVEEETPIIPPPVVTEETYIPPPYIVTEEETIPPVVIVEEETPIVHAEETVHLEEEVNIYNGEGGAIIEPEEKCVYTASVQSGTTTAYGQPTTYLTYNLHDSTTNKDVSYTYVLTTLYSGTVEKGEGEYVVYGTGAINFYNTYYGVNDYVTDKPGCSCICGYSTYTFSYSFDF